LDNIRDSDDMSDRPTGYKPNVLFLCTGNSARSQMAEAFLKRYASDRFNVYSAGLEARGMHPLTVRVMNEIGYDLRDQYSKTTREFMGKLPFRWLITVCDQADKQCPRALWANHGTKLAWAFEDPAAFEGTEEQKLVRFRAVRDQIHARIQAWVAELEAAP
jgi:arsenate reductase